MNAIKFDEEKVKKCIDVYHDMHGTYPYLILSEETRKILPSDKQISTLTISNEMILKVGNNSYSLDNEDKKQPDYGTWHGARVLVDNKLDLGEVHIG